MHKGGGREMRGHQRTDMAIMREDKGGEKCIDLEKNDRAADVAAA